MQRLTRQLIVAIVTLLIAVFVWRYATQTQQRVKAKATTAQIQTVATILLIEKPQDLSRENLQELANRYNQPNVLNDAWGNPLIVEYRDGHYIVKSLGRDGRDGGCCVQPPDATPDTDLIASDGVWRQIWY